MITLTSGQKLIVDTSYGYYTAAGSYAYGSGSLIGDYYGNATTYLSGIFTVDGVTANSGGWVVVDNGGVANNTTVNSGGVVDVSGGGVANNTTANSGADLYVQSGGVANSTTLNSGGTVVFFGDARTDSSVIFNGGGLLMLENPNLFLEDPNSFTAPISGFDADSTIDLTYIADVTTVNWNNGTLAITETTTGNIINLDLLGNYQHDSFAAVADGSNGTDIIIAPSTLDYLEASQLAYAPDDAVCLAGLAQDGFTTILPENPPTASGLTAITCINQTSHEVIVSYRGSVTQQDWTVTDLQGILGGNAAITTPVFNDALAYIQQAIDQYSSGYHFFVTGHSLGGAEAEAVASTLSLSSSLGQTDGFGGGDVFAAPAVSNLVSQWTYSYTTNANLKDYIISTDPVGNFIGSPTNQYIGATVTLPPVFYALSVAGEAALNFGASKLFGAGLLTPIINQTLKLTTGIDPSTAVFGMLQHQMYNYGQALLGQNYIPTNPIAPSLLSSPDIPSLFRALSHFTENVVNHVETASGQVATAVGTAAVNFSETLAANVLSFSESIASGLNTAKEVITETVGNLASDAITLAGATVNTPAGLPSGLNVGADGSLTVGIASPQAGQSITLADNTKGQVTMSVGGDQNSMAVPMLQLGTANLTGDSFNIDTTSAPTDTLTINIGSGDNLEVVSDASVANVSQQFAFSGSYGALTIDNASNFFGTIEGFSAGDTLDLGKLNTTSANTFAANTGLGNSITVVSDGNGGSYVTLVNPAAIPSSGSVTTFLAYLPNIGKAGVKITDSAVNVATHMDVLQANAAKVKGMALTDKVTPTLSITAGQFVQDALVLGKISTAYKLALTDKGSPTIALTASQFSQDTAVLGKISTPYGISISAETAANVAVDVKNSHVSSIAVADTVAHVSTSIATLESNVGKLSGITLTDKSTPTLSVTAAQVTSDLGVLNAISSHYLLSVKDTITNINSLSLGGVHDSQIEIMPTVLLATLTENSPITDLNLSAVSLTGDRINEKVYNGTGTELDVLNSKGVVISQLLFSHDSEAQLHLLGVNPSIVHLM